MNWRRSEWISAATLLIVAGWIWAASSRNSTLDQDTKTINEMKPKVDAHSEQLAAIIATLADVKDDVRYIRRHTAQ